MFSSTQTRNTHIERLNRIILGAFFVVGGVLLFWSVLRASWLLAREDNPRLVEAALRIQRGAIVDVDGAVLAESVGDERVQRQYHPASGALVGYYSVQYGTAGIEAQYDALLRGTQGEATAFMAQELLHQAQVGRDIRLTIKRDWQQSAADLLGDQGTAILLSVPDFAVRALVSHPTYDPNLLDAQFETLVQDEAGVLLNRALEQYQPGGVLAPFWLAEATALGLLDAESALDVSTIHKPLSTSVDVDALCSWLDAWGFLQPVALAGGAAEAQACTLTNAADALVGQDVQTVQPLQVARAWAGLTQSGSWQSLQTVAAIETEAGDWQLVRNEDVPRAVVSADVANYVLTQLAQDGAIVDYSTDALAGPDATNAWYLGAFPADAPQFVLVIVAENSEAAEVEAIGRQLLRSIINSD